MNRKILIFILLVMTDAAFAFKSNEFEVIRRPVCGEESKIFRQKGGPFALLIHCEDALGTHASLIYFANMDVPSRGKWNIYERVWRESKWANQILDFAWIGSDALVVTTSGVGEFPGVYLVSLIEKKSQVIFTPKDEEAEITIEDYKAGTLSIMVETAEKETKHQIKIPR